ncbi:hypothetical protein P7D79_03755 [Enterococcus avium]|uniref:Phage tail protein n=1 Tax=Enterococcus avium TaxID=33945 RepID=A0ABD5F5N7_ENTAV|nr:hypothetical protein [Enterococcus avium]MDT2513345.1 hypothetical protein [Enterococcus avium]
MAASGVGQFSINVKSNLKDFYGDLTKAKRTMKELTDKKNQLQIDSAQLDKLRDKSQRIAAEMRELRQQKTEIKLGMKNVEDADKELKNLDQKLASLNRQKLEVDAEIQPIRTANVELHKVEQEIDRINGQKVEIDIGDMTGKIGDGLDTLSSKVMGLVKAIGTISFAGLAAGVGVLKEAVNAASDLEQNTGGVEKLFGDSAQAVIKNSDTAYKNAGISKNEYLEQATSFSASLITSLGGDQAEAAKYVDKALVDMSDNVNTFGTNAGLVQNAYEGFAKGNYTMLDNLKLGFGGTQEGAKQLINTYGGLDHEVTDMAEVTFPLLIESIHNAQKAMNVSGTTAKEAATTYEGSFKMMKGAWNDFLATGDPSHLADSVPIYLENLDKKLKELTPKIIDGVKQLVKELPPKLKPIVEDIKKLIGESLNSIFGEDFTKNFVEGMKPFTDIIKKVFDMLSKSTKGKKPDLSWVGSVVPNLLKLAVGLKSASLLFKGISFASGLGLKLPSFKGLGGFGKSVKEIKTVGIDDLKSLGLKMLTIAGIAANIYLAAKSLQEVQKVGDLKGLQPKLLVIAEAIVGMGALTAAVGFIADKKPDMIISGLATIAGISANIWLAAKALQQVGQIDPDFASIQLKIGQIALCIAEIGVLALAVGALMSTGVGAGFLIAGLAAILGIAGTMWLTAKALASIGNMELDSGKIKSSIETIKTAIGDIGMMAFDGDPFEKIAELINSFIQLGIVASVVGIGNQLVSLQEIELDSGIVKTKIATIKESLVEFSTFGFDGSVFEKLGELLNSFMSLGIVGNIVGIGNELLRIQDIELEDELVRKNVQTIKDCLSDISSFGFDGSVFDKLGEFINSFISDGIVGNILAIGQELEKIQKLKLDEEAVGKKVKTIKKLIETVSSGSLINAIKTFESGTVKAAALVPVLAIFAELKKIGDILVKIQSLGLTEESLQEQINVIKNAINSISSFATDDIVNNLTGMSLALDAILVKLTQKFPPEFNKLGEILADKLNKGFRKKLNLQAALSEKIRNLQTDGASAAGAKIAEAINAGLANNLNIGDTIRESIRSALQEKYSTKIDVELNTTETKTTTKKKKSSNSSTTKASGGLVAVKTPQAILTDSPEKPLLNNGEYVIPEKIVSVLGVPFLEKLRSGQISRTFAGLAQSVSHTTSSVVNNIYHNNNTQNMNVYTTGNEDLVLKGNRRFRMA